MDLPLTELKKYSQSHTQQIKIFESLQEPGFIYGATIKNLHNIFLRGLGVGLKAVIVSIT